MTLSIDVGCIDARGKLSWNNIGLGGLGVGSIPGGEQPAFSPARQIDDGVDTLTYLDANRRLQGSGAATPIHIHALAASYLETGDDIRDPDFDKVYIEGRNAEDSGLTTLQMGVVLAALGPDDMGIAVPGFAISLGGRVVLDGTASTPAGMNSTDDDRIMFAFDFANLLVWYGVNGVWNNGDPVVPAGGDAISSSFTVDGQVLSLRGTGRSTGSWELPPITLYRPAGYESWPFFDVTREPILTLDQTNTIGIVSNGAGNRTAGIRFDSDGNVYEVRESGDTQRNSPADWIVPKSASPGSYEVRSRVPVGDGWDSSPVADDTWVAVSTDPEWSVTDTDPGGGTQKLLTVDFEIRKGSSGSALITNDYTFQANRTS